MLAKATVLVIAESPPEDSLLEPLRTAGIAAEIDLPLRDGGEQGEIATLASALVRYERLLGERPPRAVVVAGRGDRALAATLAATKLVIPVAVLSNGDAHLLELLADRKLSADAGEIQAWIEGLSTLP